MILHGDCLEHLRNLESESIDSLVTDPPAGISFMGKSWDGDKGGRTEWVAWMAEVMRECLRVMKPGAHGLVWSLPRTSHWTATACEDAGFEVRDCVYHLFGSGFPKSLDVSKAIDKAAGAERGSRYIPHGDNEIFANGKGKAAGVDRTPGAVLSDPPKTDAAKQWQGFGTALKPAVECWWLIRKPLSEKTVAKNVQKWRTGALNIDASRVEATGEDIKKTNRLSSKHKYDWEYKKDTAFKLGAGADISKGRFPSHLLLSHSALCTDDTCAVDCAVAQLDAQSGQSKSVQGKTRGPGGQHGKYSAISVGKERVSIGDSGGASRFFYVAKISASERNAGLEGMEAKPMGKHQSSLEGGKMLTGSGNSRSNVKVNHHPTVKPQKLMRYLCRMVTPPGGVVLDPFMGSGSTGLAAISEGFQFVGIEREPEYVAIAEKRIEAACGI